MLLVTTKHRVIHMKGSQKLPAKENIALIILSGKSTAFRTQTKTAKSNYVKKSYPWAVCWFSVAL